MSVIFEHYRTLESFLDTVENRPYNDIFKSSEKASQRPEGARRDFYHTKSYKESTELLKNGYQEPMEAMKKELLKIDKKTTHEKSRPFASVVGYAPIVPHAIMGLPLSMINQKRTPEKAKTIHLLYGFSALGNVRPSELIKGGTMFIGLLNSLEKQGFRVKLDIVRCTTSSETDAIGYTVNLKEYSQSLNLLKLCYPLVHPSMLRRTSFKWCETLPNLDDRRYLGTMGASLIARMGYMEDKEQACIKEKAFLREHGVLNDKNSYYCNVYEAMDADNINDLAQKMGLIK